MTRDESHNLAAETALLLCVRDARDTDAFDRLFNALSPRILGYLVHSGGCQVCDGEALLQDVWTTVWLKTAQFDAGRAAARTWIFAIARNVLIESKRREAREARMRANQLIDPLSESPEAGQLDARDGARARALLDHLAPEQAQVIRLACIEGKSHRDIARELDVPLGTIKSRVRLGLQRLRSLLSLAVRHDG